MALTYALGLLSVLLLPTHPCILIRSGTVVSWWSEFKVVEPSVCHRR